MPGASTRYVVARQLVRHARAGSAPRLLMADAASSRVSLGMVILCGVQNFGYYGVMIRLPNYLGTRFHFGLTRSATWSAVTISGMAIGIFAFGQAADRIGRRPAFLSWMLGAAIMVVVYSRLTDPMALLIGYGAGMSELYPTAARATAQNALFNIGRAIGGFGPVVIGSIAVAHGFETAVALSAVLYGLDIPAMRQRACPNQPK